MIGTLKTDRLELRPIDGADAVGYFRFYSDPSVMRYIGKGEIVESVEKVRQSIEKHQRTHHQEQALGLWSVFLASDGIPGETLVGHCGTLFWDIDGVREYEIAYLLGREFRGRGYATEAACVVRDWGFQERSFSRMISLIYPENVASIKVAERIGMTYEKNVIVMEDVEVRQYAIENPNQGTAG
jgi:RimJ/RimL family protein N-acetyltransferase